MYLCKIKRNRMKKNIDSYRLTSLEEPSDEMLLQIMREVAEDAKQKSDAAHKRYFEDLAEMISKKLEDWNRKYNISFQ